MALAPWLNINPLQFLEASESGAKLGAQLREAADQLGLGYSGLDLKSQLENKSLDQQDAQQKASLAQRAAEAAGQQSIAGARLKGEQSKQQQLQDWREQNLGLGEQRLTQQQQAAKDQQDNQNAALDLRRQQIEGSQSLGQGRLDLATQKANSLNTGGSHSTGNADPNLSMRMNIYKGIQDRSHAKLSKGEDLNPEEKSRLDNADKQMDEILKGLENEGKQFKNKAGEIGTMINGKIVPNAPTTTSAPPNAPAPDATPAGMYARTLYGGMPGYTDTGGGGGMYMGQPETNQDTSAGDSSK